MPMAKGMSFKVFIGFFIFTLFLPIPSVSAPHLGVKITTKVVPGDDDFFIEVSAYGVYHPSDTLSAPNLTEVPWQSFMFYVSNSSSYIIWRGSSKFHRAFHSNGSWYLLLQGGYPLLRIDGKPFSRTYPYNLTYTSITIYRIKNGCIGPTWIIPTPSPGVFGSARLENGTIILSSYSQASGRAFVVRLPLKSFERHVSVTNASAFADLLSAVQLPNSNVIIFFPELYYFRSNGTVYGGTFRNGRFIPIFRGNKAYIFVYNGSLITVPIVRANLNLGKVFPEITAHYSLRTCYQKNSTEMSFPGTPTVAALLSLGIGLVTGTIIVHLLKGWRRKVNARDDY